MYFQLRHGVYSFVYYDTDLKKNVRLPKNMTPVIKSDQEAEAFIARWEAKKDSIRVRILRRLEWESKYTNFQELLEIFSKAKQEDAPNTWHDQLSHMRYHVLPFFLGVRGENNLNLWPDSFEAFRDHLETGEVLKGTHNSKELAYSTKNNIINALNSFMDVMYRRRFVDQKYLCRHFPERLLNKSNETSIIDENTQNTLFEKLKDRYPMAADMFWVSLHTGMRMNEAIGLSLDDVFAENVESEFIRQALKPYDMKPLGFIMLESQPKCRNKPRDEKGHVERKPLKGKRRIDPEDSRVIPIFDKTAFNIIARRWNHQREAFQSKNYGPSLKDYLLFDGLNCNSYAQALRLAQEKLKVTKPHTAHDTRHTYSTWLAEQTGGNYTLCRMILGHSDLEMTMRYVHLNAKIKRQLKTKSQLKEQMSYVA